MSVFPEVECKLRSSYPTPEIPTAKQGRLEEMPSCKTLFSDLCLHHIISLWFIFQAVLSLCLQNHLKFAFGLIIMGVRKFSTWFFFKIMNKLRTFEWMFVYLCFHSCLLPFLASSHHPTFLTCCLFFFCLCPNIPSGQFWPEPPSSLQEV